MKISEAWLREWVTVAAPIKDISARLVMAGLELEIEAALAAPLKNVVVGRIESLTPHPQADKLRVAQVDVGGQTLQIVCGAPNAREGMLAPTALVGATLPGNVEISDAKLRGVDSSGMLCSAKELALAEKSEGLLELDPDAKPGTPIPDYLKLDDRVLALEITPNRGDCLSVRGLAREVGALFGAVPSGPKVEAAAIAIKDEVKVELENRGDCPNYAGRVIEGLDRSARTPDWMREKLRRSGIRSIHPVVDVTNFVMIELGQPMHAFDRTKLAGAVRVRRAKPGESLRLLNNQLVQLSTSDLLITDDRGPLALAGVMGGAESEVASTTTTVFLESACFAPNAVAGAGRRYKLTSDAVYRFERGVDPAIQREALERATQLLQQICGGKAGPVTHAGDAKPASIRVPLRQTRLRTLLGYEIAANEVEALLKRLGIEVSSAGPGAWQCTVPSCRYDLRIEEDLIEEVARLYGYDRIPLRAYPAQLQPAAVPEGRRAAAATRAALAARGWQEAVTYSFVEPGMQSLLAPGVEAIAVDNPIADPLSVMRTTLWSGLIPAWRYNVQRQQKRVRLFEIAVCFRREGGRVVESQRLAGIASGGALPEQWGTDKRAVDFFDVKGDLQAVLGRDHRYLKRSHPALHPGRCAQVLRGEQPIGWLGAMHPSLVQKLDLPETPLLFELDWEAIAALQVPKFHPLSEFPSSRRDLAPVLPEAVTVEAVCASARSAAGEQLREIRVFDLYRGEPLGAGFKSLALGLIFQDYSRTLTDVEIDTAMKAVMTKLEQEFGAAFRS
jgi:phenylalanyl-tRNA synthetase beta chain